MNVAELFAELGIKVDLAAFAAADARLRKTQAEAALFTEMMTPKASETVNTAAKAMEMIGLDADATMKEMQERSIARAKRWRAGIASAMKFVAGAALVGYGIAQAVKGVAVLGDAYNSAASRVRSLTDDTQKQIDINRQLYQSAQDTATSFGSVAELYQQVGKAAVDNGRTLEQGVQLVDTINKALKAGGSTGESADRALQQLSQGLGSGTLRGEEFNAVLEQAPILIDIIAKDLGKSRGEMRKLAEGGKLTSKVILGALDRQKDAIEEAYGKRIPLMTDEFVRMRNEVEKAIGELLQDRKVAEGFQSAIRGVTRALVGVTRALAATVVFFSRHTALLKTLLVGLGVAFTVLAVQAGIAWLAVAGPIALVAAAIAAFVFYFEDLVALFVEGIFRMGEIFGRFVRRIERGVQAIGRFFANIPKAVRRGFQEAFDYVHGLIDKLVDRLNNIQKEIRKKGPIGFITDALGLPGLSDIPVVGKPAKEIMKRVPGVGMLFGGNPFGLAGEGISHLLSSAPSKSFAPGGRTVNVGDTTIHVQSNSSDPAAVAVAARDAFSEMWDIRMREAGEAVG